MRSIALPSWIERAAGLDPRALPPHAFGLARRELSYAAFGGDSGSRALLEAQSVPLPEELFGEGPLGQPVGAREGLVAAVRLLLSRLGKAPKEACLVLPDSWARGLMIDSADLPQEPAARREVLRFRLKRLVPFRTEDLRVAAVPLETGPADGPRRAFAAFASESLCALVEGGFGEAGVRIGWISGATAALHAGLRRAVALDETDPEFASSILGLAVVDADGFTLVLSRHGEPVVWRQKSFTEGLADADRERLLTTELRLTRAFLEERHPGSPIVGLYLSSPRAVEPFWSRVLGDGLGIAPVRLRQEHVGLADGGGAGDAGEILALAGAVAREI